MPIWCRRGGGAGDGDNYQVTGKAKTLRDQVVLHHSLLFLEILKFTLSIKNCILPQEGAFQALQEKNIWLGHRS